MEYRLCPRPRPRLFAWFCLAGLALPAALVSQTSVPQTAAAQAGPGGPAEVRILARNQETTKDRIFASGDVEVRYREFLLPVLRRSCRSVEVPMAGLTIGRQLQWLNEKRS